VICFMSMDDPLDIEIRRQRSEWQTKATAATEARQVAAQREHEAEVALAYLRALERAAELRPSVSQPPSSSAKPHLADSPTRAQGAGRKGRKFGAISKTWRGILEEMAVLLPGGATDEQIAEIGRAGKLPNLRARDARRQMLKYKGQGFVDYANQSAPHLGWVIAAAAAARFKIEQPSDTETAPDSQSGAVYDLSSAPRDSSSNSREGQNTGEGRRGYGS
jgi:hypothetical protein